LIEKKNGRTYNAIVLDTHSDNPSGLDVAKRIHSKSRPKDGNSYNDTKEYLPFDCLKTTGIKDNEILTMPFEVSRLVKALN
jgi:two-component system, OmpR family, response regulator